MHRLIAIVAGVSLASTAGAARKTSTTREPDAQPVWEQPGGRAKARMELAEALLDAGFEGPECLQPHQPVQTSLF